MVRYCFSLYYRYHVCRTFLGLNVCDWSNSMKLWYVLAVRIQGRILANYIAMNLKRDPYVIVNFEQIHTALFRVQKTACASYHCCCCLDSRQCRKVKKKGIQSKFSTRQVFPSTLFCTFFFPFPPSTMSSTRWTGKNKEQSFAQTLCFFNCYCFIPQYVVS